jgi:multimeric flavodoxin WrbA/putative sterol carrier protein
VEIVNIAASRIEPCRGCFCCWEKTPGKCVIADDMETLLRKYREADMVMWTFPLYYFGIPSKIKAFMDRLLPLNLPFIVERENGGAAHPGRFDLSMQKHVLISTCGFFTVENNYDALVKQFDILFSSNYAKILCPEGELFRVPQLRERIDEYLALVRQAGAEFASSGGFSSETEKLLAEPLYPKEAFLKMANASWEIAETPNVDKSTVCLNPAERLMRQMAAVYTPPANAPKGEKRIEFFFTDTLETYQLRINESSCAFVEDGKETAPSSLRIETPFSVWQDVSNGKMSGADALFLRKYRVLGDFSLMMSVMNGFSTRKPPSASQKKRSMLVLLLPWLAFWLFPPIFQETGAFAAILISAFTPLLSRFFRFSPYETVGTFLVSVLSAAFLAGFPLPLAVTLSYALFGGLWLASLFSHIPLCAWYSAGDYDGDTAFRNPLFIHTNRILAAVWGVLYLCVSVWTWFFMRSVYASLIGLVNSIAPTLAGIFTAFFAKRYPAWYAGRK